MRRLKALFSSIWGEADRRVRLGRILGFFFATAGFVVIGFAWNGAASRNFITGQFPYLLSGGFMGLALVVFGSALLFLSTVRAERQLMTEKFDEMSRLLGRNLSRLSYSMNGQGESQGQVVAAGSAYHRKECKVLVGKEDVSEISVEQADAEGLEPCRVCSPPRPEKIADPRRAETAGVSREA